MVPCDVIDTFWWPNIQYRAGSFKWPSHSLPLLNHHGHPSKEGSLRIYPKHQTKKKQKKPRDHVVLHVSYNQWRTVCIAAKMSCKSEAAPGGLTQQSAQFGLKCSLRRGRFRVTDNDKRHGVSLPPPKKTQKISCCSPVEKDESAVPMVRRPHWALAKHNNAGYLVGIEAEAQTGSSEDVHQQVSNLDLICSLVLTLMMAWVFIIYIFFNSILCQAISFAAVWTRLWYPRFCASDNLWLWFQFWFSLSSLLVLSILGTLDLWPTGRSLSRKGQSAVQPV